MGTPTKTQAESSIKSLVFELGNLTPSAMVTLFEIDLSKILESKSIPNLTADSEAVGFKGNVDNVLRFHNNIKVFNSKIIWNGNDYNSLYRVYRYSFQNNPERIYRLFSDHLELSILLPFYSIINI